MAQQDDTGAFTEGTQITVALDLAATISGVVVDHNDKPVNRAFIR